MRKRAQRRGREGGGGRRRGGFCTGFATCQWKKAGSVVSVTTVLQYYSVVLLSGSV